jgi:predicted Fe-S protein YdhL (DUF1289 family)
MGIETPCVNICAFDYSRGVCYGCGRTAEEIANWLGYSREQRREIMARLEKEMADTFITLPKAP